MNEEIKTITDLALCQAVAHDKMRLALTRPYNHENGNTYATDGRILLSIPSSICKEYEPFQDARFPDVVRELEDRTSRSKDTYMNLMLANMVDTPSDVRIGSLLVRNAVYNKVRDITALLGLKGWRVRECVQSVILEHELFTLLVMGILESKNTVTIPLSICPLPTSMDIDAAKEYAKVLEEKEQKHKEEQDIRSCIYTFTVVRYATMYVKADSIEEAKHIARRHRNDIDSWDFEDPKIDSYDGMSEEPDSSMGTIYTDEGECSYDEVCAQIEEEINEHHNQ